MALTPLDVLTGAGIDPDKAIDIYEHLKQKFEWSPITHRPENEVDITIRCSGNPTLWYFGTDQRAYRMDEPIYAGDFMPSVREAQIALALIDVSADRLKDKTL